MSRSDDGSVPVAHKDIVSIFEAVRARPIANALLALLELLQQTEVSGYYYGVNGMLTMLLSAGKDTPLAGIATQETISRHLSEVPGHCSPLPTNFLPLLYFVMFKSSAANPYEDIVGQ
jgi:hypothetical protein